MNLHDNLAHFVGQLIQEQITRCVGFMHLFIGTTAIGVDHGDKPLMRGHDFTSVGFRLHTKQAAGTENGLIAR